jgi:hypothetical protein
VTNASSTLGFGNVLEFWYFSISLSLFVASLINPIFKKNLKPLWLEGAFTVKGAKGARGSMFCKD